MNSIATPPKTRAEVMAREIALCLELPARAKKTLKALLVQIFEGAPPCILAVGVVRRRLKRPLLAIVLFSIVREPTEEEERALDDMTLTHARFSSVTRLTLDSEVRFLAAAPEKTPRNGGAAEAWLRKDYAAECRLLAFETITREEGADGRG